MTIAVDLRTRFWGVFLPTFALKVSNMCVMMLTLVAALGGGCGPYTWSPLTSVVALPVGPSSPYSALLSLAVLGVLHAADGILKLLLRKVREIAVLV